MDPFDQFTTAFEDLSGTFTVTDVVLSMTLSFLMCAIVGFTYRTTHRGISYSQSYVQTLVFMGMIVALVMLIVGSNLARAFALVGALSIIRFRNAVKETRDVGFIFFAMAIGMAMGTKFYVLGVVATAVICGAIVLMERFNWFQLNVQSQVAKIQLPAGEDHSKALDNVMLSFTDRSDLVSMEDVRAGALTEHTFMVRLRQGKKPEAFLAALRALSGTQKVTLLTGYDRTDL